MTAIEPTSNVRPVGIENEMRSSYLDYAMSVIVSRALPEARDGLKPVQRRIIWGMWDGGARAGAAYRKSARIVGDVMGRYHPHGDAPVYDAMIRMAQGKGERIDYARLLSDLLWWSESVQIAWSRSYWRVHAPAELEEISPSSLAKCQDSNEEWKALISDFPRSE